jgi:CO/xanthine dehydrogenase Mo-binding subunit
MGDYSVVGKSVMRVDALEKVTGKAVYCTDIKLPGMLHVKVLRSPNPHAKIISIDTTKAVKLSGVKCVLTGDDVPSNRYGSVVRDSTILAQGVVRAVGEPVVAVAAETLEAAEEALELIEVKYELLPAMFDVEEAVSTQPPVVIHPDLFKYEPASSFFKLGKR